MHFNRLSILLGVIFLFALYSQELQAGGDDPVAWWTFDEAPNQNVLENVSMRSYPLGGNYSLMSGVKGKCLKSDGFTTNIKGNIPIEDIRDYSEVSISAWVALEAYPWNRCAIISGKNEENLDWGYEFSIGSEGQLIFNLAVEGSWKTCESEMKIPLYKWAYVCGTYDPENGTRVFINGKLAGTNDYRGQLTLNGRFSIARNTEELIPTHHHRPYGNFPSKYSFDGLIDELKIFDSALGEEVINQEYESDKPLSDPAFVPRKLPKGPEKLKNVFKAYATRLSYYPEYDAVWRSDAPQDIVVTFDEHPVRVVAWRGIRGAPSIVVKNKNLDNDIWVADQSGEYWAGKPRQMGTQGCCEHMSDAQCRYSRVRLVENNDARIVIHWRYAPTDVLYRLPYENELTGWGTWIDEYYYIYPDAVYTRVYDVFTDHPIDQLQETTIVNPPRTLPEDNIEKSAISLADMKGNSKSYLLKENFRTTRFPGLDHPNIHMTNIKSDYRPFIIHDTTGLSTHLYMWNTAPCSYFSMWNHFPVAIQTPSDGRQAIAPDRASSTAFVMTKFPPVSQDSRKKTYAYLTGVTDESVSSLVPLSKSWLYPAALKGVSEGFSFEGYNKTERAYILSCQEGEKHTNLEFEIAASKEHPVQNLAFVVKNWGNAGASLQLNGKPVEQGKDFRFGYREQMGSTDLIVFVKTDAVKSTEIEITAY